MYKTKHSKRSFSLSAIAAGLAICGSASAAITYYNLTGDPAESGGAVPSNSYTIEQAIFTTDTSAIPQLNNIVGTGVLDPFVRIHKNDANCGNQQTYCQEFGYNTTGDGSKPQSPESAGTKDNEGSNWNYTLALDTISTVDIGGTTYRAFILDINDSQGNGQNNPKDNYLSLDQFRLFTSDNANLDNYTCGAAGQECTSAEAQIGNPTTYDPTQHGFLDGTATKIFDLDICPPNAICDRTLGLNSALTSGSGNGVDLVVYVPDALFKDANGNYQEFVYLFSSFGELGINDGTPPADPNVPAASLPPGDFGQSGGFEEWAVLKKTPITPTLALLAIGLLGMGGLRRLQAGPRFA